MMVAISADLEHDLPLHINEVDDGVGISVVVLGTSIDLEHELQLNEDVISVVLVATSVGFELDSTTDSSFSSTTGGSCFLFGCPSG